MWDAIWRALLFLGTVIADDVYDGEWRHYRISSQNPCDAQPTVTLCIDDGSWNGTVPATDYSSWDPDQAEFHQCWNGSTMCGKQIVMNYHCWGPDHAASCSARVNFMLDELKVFVETTCNDSRAHCRRQRDSLPQPRHQFHSSLWPQYLR